MPIAEKAEALLNALTPAELDAMSPGARRRFAALCRRTAEMAEPRQDQPTSGVLYALRSGAPRHE